MIDLQIKCTHRCHKSVEVGYLYAKQRVQMFTTDCKKMAALQSRALGSLSEHIQSARVWSITGCQLGNGATDFYRLNMAKSRRKKFGVYADPLSPAIEYAKHNALFEEGSPAMFWLHLNSGAMEEFQQQIQRKLNGKVGDGGGQLRPGSLVLARYRVDGQVYRAKVEHTVVEEGKVVLVRVRYIDYGNSSEIQSKDDLYTWDPLLEFVPAQAVLCTFHGAPASFLAKSSLALMEHQAFNSMMSSRMKIVVHRRLHPVPLLVFRPDVCLLNKPELEVALMDKDEMDVLGKISKHPAFREDFQHVSVSVAPPKFLKNSPLTPLSTDRPFPSTAPPPLHLVKEPLVQVDLDQDQVVMADIVPSAPTGLEKVSSWLENKTENTGEMSRSELPMSASNSGSKFSFPAVDIRVSDQVSCTQQMADLVVHPTGPMFQCNICPDVDLCHPSCRQIQTARHEAWRDRKNQENASARREIGALSGGGGSRGGFGGGRGCHKCGEDSHFARECRAGGGGGACHKCGQEGHFARECTGRK